MTMWCKLNFSWNSQWDMEYIFVMVLESVNGFQHVLNFNPSQGMKDWLKIRFRLIELRVQAQT